MRGVDDQIVSDMSLFDFGTLGKLGAVPGWPGDEVFPPQPMVSQTRYVLNLYQSEGGEYEEVAFEDVGHTPYLERPEEFMLRSPRTSRAWLRRPSSRARSEQHPVRFTLLRRPPPAGACR